MTQPLVIAVSPYHITTREAPAVAALQLADSVVTLLPAPAAGRTRADVERAVHKSPRYLRLLDSWRWTMPLWHEGVVASAHEDDDVAGKLPGSYERIAAEDDYAGLRPLMKHAASARPDQFLDLLSADILKGGPDPALNIPVSAAIDSFAARHSLVVARAAPTSVAQRAEARLGTRSFAVAVPVLLHASARLILRVREELGDELASLRRALLEATREALADERAGADAQTELARAAKEYAAAFERLRSRLEGRDDDDGVRIIAGWVSLTGLVVPADIAMRSGIAAARAMNMRGMPSRGGPNGRHAAAEKILVLVIKPLSARPDAAA